MTAAQIFAVLEKVSNGHSPQIHVNGELLMRMCRGESHFSQKWPLANVGESGESSQHGLANVGEYLHISENGEFWASTRIHKICARVAIP